ncbi:hypothetical protein FRB96_007052 [Tulasnella sp. 330]|nr:hypothetical protein FRB96_007052 [Tulasnella sp. 330]KAG8872592.1 hypothetical protein FRB97_007490 [Tulasnella sp. 331]
MARQRSPKLSKTLVENKNLARLVRSFSDLFWNTLTEENYTIPVVPHLTNVTHVKVHGPSSVSDCPSMEVQLATFNQLTIGPAFKHWIEGQQSLKELRVVSAWFKERVDHIVIPTLQFLSAPFHVASIILPHSPVLELECRVYLDDIQALFDLLRNHSPNILALKMNVHCDPLTRVNFTSIHGLKHLQDLRIVGWARANMMDPLRAIRTIAGTCPELRTSEWQVKMLKTVEGIEYLMQSLHSVALVDGSWTIATSKLY